MIRSTGRALPVTEDIRRGEATPEDNPWFWNPGLFGIRREPADFRAALDEMGHPDIAACWNPRNERWQVFARAPRVQTPVCRGWRLLFFVQDSQRQYVPLDVRTLAKIVSISADANGNGLRYFDRVWGELQRDKTRAEERVQQESWEQSGEYFDYTKPKVGFGAISRSKTVGQ
jgi:hypothetical protein